jgi:hypothetical protein
MGLKLCPFVDFVLGEKFMIVIDGYISKISSNI